MVGLQEILQRCRPMDLILIESLKVAKRRIYMYMYTTEMICACFVCEIEQGPINIYNISVSNSIVNAWL